VRESKYKARGTPGNTHGAGFFFAAVVRLARRPGGTTLREVVTATERPMSQCASRVGQMVRSGRLIKEGEPRARRYRLNPDMGKKEKA
jgi:hypothetical protein